jgi:hypothetical protein
MDSIKINEINFFTTIYLMIASWDFDSCVGHQVLFIVNKLNLILKHHMVTSMEPHVIIVGRFLMI